MVKKRDFSTTRSAGYQYLLLESSTTPEVITECSDQYNFHGINDNVNSELMHDLKDQLKEERWKLILSQLTSRQKQVIKLWAKGKTQIEIAKILSVNQSSVTKSINGNVDYRNGKKGKRVYGGAKKKLRKLQAKDPVIQDILQQIFELENNIP